ncbi:hypothetical protein HK101_008778 [Irineochytrium annulatum]|nr:hypothetical protein HK101_008778 [Irineochytrium annulatum]
MSTAGNGKHGARDGDRAGNPPRRNWHRNNPFNIDNTARDAREGREDRDFDLFKNRKSYRKDRKPSPAFNFPSDVGRHPSSDRRVLPIPPPQTSLIAANMQRQIVGLESSLDDANREINLLRELLAKERHRVKSLQAAAREEINPEIVSNNLPSSDDVSARSVTPAPAATVKEVQTDGNQTQHDGVTVGALPTTTEAVDCAKAAEPDEQIPMELDSEEEVEEEEMQSGISLPLDAYAKVDVSTQAKLEEKNNFRPRRARVTEDARQYSLERHACSSLLVNELPLDTCASVGPDPAPTTVVVLSPIAEYPLEPEPCTPSVPHDIIARISGQDSGGLQASFIPTPKLPASLIDEAKVQRTPKPIAVKITEKQTALPEMAAENSDEEKAIFALAVSSLAIPAPAIHSPTVLAPTVPVLANIPAVNFASVVPAPTLPAPTVSALIVDEARNRTVNAVVPSTKPVTSRSDRLEALISRLLSDDAVNNPPAMPVFNRDGSPHAAECTSPKTLPIRRETLSTLAMDISLEATANTSTDQALKIVGKPPSSEAAILALFECPAKDASSKAAMSNGNPETSHARRPSTSLASKKSGSGSWSETDSDEEDVNPGRERTPPRLQTIVQKVTTALTPAVSQPPVKRPVGRPRKVITVPPRSTTRKPEGGAWSWLDDDTDSEAETTDASNPAPAPVAALEVMKKRRGRPPKVRPPTEVVPVGGAMHSTSGVIPSSGASKAIETSQAIVAGTRLASPEKSAVVVGSRAASHVAFMAGAGSASQEKSRVAGAGAATQPTIASSLTVPRRRGRPPKVKPVTETVKPATEVVRPAAEAVGPAMKSACVENPSIRDIPAVTGSVGGSKGVVLQEKRAALTSAKVIAKEVSIEAKACSTIAERLPKASAATATTTPVVIATAPLSGRHITVGGVELGQTSSQANISKSKVARLLSSTPKPTIAFPPRPVGGWKDFISWKDILRGVKPTMPKSYLFAKINSHVKKYLVSNGIHPQESIGRICAPKLVSSAVSSVIVSAFWDEIIGDWVSDPRAAKIPNAVDISQQGQTAKATVVAPVTVETAFIAPREKVAVFTPQTFTRAVVSPVEKSALTVVGAPAQMEAGKAVVLRATGKETAKTAEVTEEPRKKRGRPPKKAVAAVRKLFTLNSNVKAQIIGPVPQKEIRDVAVAPRKRGRQRKIKEDVLAELEDRPYVDIFVVPGEDLLWPPPKRRCRQASYVESSSSSSSSSESESESESSDSSQWESEDEVVEPKNRSRKRKLEVEVDADHGNGVEKSDVPKRGRGRPRKQVKDGGKASEEREPKRLQLIVPETSTTSPVFVSAKPSHSPSRTGIAGLIDYPSDEEEDADTGSTRSSVLTELSTDSSDSERGVIERST